VDACLDVRDLVLIELTLPPLSGRRLQVALQAEIEALLLEDVADVAYAHGPQSADGLVAVAWLGKDAVEGILDAFQTSGLQLVGLHLTPLLLPVEPRRATLHACGEHLLVRTARDRGWVQWHRTGGACADLMQLHARLRGEGIDAVQWVGPPIAGWPDEDTDVQLPLHQQCSGPLPTWSLPLPDTRGGSSRLALAFVAATVLLSAVALQGQTWHWAQQEERLQVQAARQMAEVFPEVGEVIDPVLQARRAVEADDARPLAAPEVQQIAATTLQAVPALAGVARAMEYRQGVLELELDPDVARQGDPVLLEQWQLALQAQGLDLVAQRDGRIRIHTGGQR